MSDVVDLMSRECDTCPRSISDWEFEREQFAVTCFQVDGGLDIEPFLMCRLCSLRLCTVDGGTA